MRLLKIRIIQLRIKGQKKCLVNLEKVTAKWTSSSTVEGNTLTNLSFTVLPGELRAIVGQVGSGKVKIIIINLI